MTPRVLSPTDVRPGRLGLCSPVALSASPAWLGSTSHAPPGTPPLAAAFAVVPLSPSAMLLTVWGKCRMPNTLSGLALPCHMLG